MPEFPKETRFLLELASSASKWSFFMSSLMTRVCEAVCLTVDVFPLVVLVGLLSVNGKLHAIEIYFAPELQKILGVRILFWYQVIHCGLGVRLE